MVRVRLHWSYRLRAAVPGINFLRFCLFLHLSLYCCNFHPLTRVYGVTQYSLLCDHRGLLTKAFFVRFVRMNVISVNTYYPDKIG